MFVDLLKASSHQFGAVVAFNPEKDKLLQLDFTAANAALTNELVNDTEAFSQYINNTLSTAGALYGIGGYEEHRTVYSRSKVFDSNEEPRRLHLGVDIWGKAGTVVRAPLGGLVHSVAFNDAYGDYGATIILQHQRNTIAFHTLYGHLSRADIAHWQEGKYISQGEIVGHFGNPDENGNWPPHLHFQIIVDMEFKEGDYPGVCKFSEREKYLANCPNPDLILQLMQYAVK
jgi:murein DD-endopeptidase MepM/ murein hydrolase activator NlpD